MDTYLRESPTLRTFKRRLKLTFIQPPNILTHSLYGKNSVQHSRMRMGLSALNGQRADYHLIPDALCSCGAPSENALHYFLECPHHNAIRTILLQDMGQLLRPSGTTASTESHQLINIILNGSPNLNLDDNKLLFKRVHMFIGNSKRFN